MKLDEWKSLVKAVNADIKGMAKAQQVQASVHGAIQHRAANPMEEQLIDADAFDQGLGQPKTVIIHGVKVKISKLHRAGIGAKDVKGADLFYEISDKKFVLVQYKSPSASGRVSLDDVQLSELQSNCPNTCPSSVRFSCGSWFAIRSTTGDAYFPACEARRIFGDYSSRKFDAFINGLTKKQFQKEFGKCHIGARTKPIKLSILEEMAILFDRVVFVVTQSGPSDV